MIKDYFSLFKFRYHLSFISVIFGALLFTKTIDPTLLLTILLVYISSTFFMYSGIYTLNDLIDYKVDIIHPTKKNRAIPSGRIKKSHALIFALSMIAIGLIIALFTFRNLIGFYFAFILINFFYSLYAKKVPYLELITNSLTHPLRFVLGAAIVNVTVPLGLILAYFLVALGFATERRAHEMKHPGYMARKVLGHYTRKKLTFLEVLSFIIMLSILIVNIPSNTNIYLLFLLVYLLFVFTPRKAGKFKPIFDRLWLK